MYLRKINIALALVVLTASCKKMVQVGPPITNPGSATVYTNAAQAAAVLTSIYGKMSSDVLGFAGGRQSITIAGGLSSDEFRAYSQLAAFYNTLYTNSPDVNLVGIWRDLYKHIYVANAALEGIERSTAIVDSIKNQLVGEAKFMRAFLHFYLVNLFGDVPLTMTTDYQVNMLASRTPSAQVYDQIIKDLQDAKNLLGPKFYTPAGAVTTERVRPNKVAATAMLARVYLYRKQWADAEAQATEVLNNADFGLNTLANAFLKNQKEAIFQLAPTTAFINTIDGNAFLRTVAPSATEPVSLTDWMVNAFEENDNRKMSWIDSTTINSVKYYHPKKYKAKGGGGNTNITEYLMVLRFAEQYLIRAEARANLGNFTGAGSAEDDVNAIRQRAGLADTTATSQEEMLTIILHERRIELFTEWGHRWLDLKRTDKANEVMSVITPLKGGTWSPDWQLYAIPQAEMQNAPNLRPQNPGYN